MRLMVGLKTPKVVENLTQTQLNPTMSCSCQVVLQRRGICGFSWGLENLSESFRHYRKVRTPFFLLTGVGAEEVHDWYQLRQAKSLWKDVGCSAPNIFSVSHGSFCAHPIVKLCDPLYKVSVVSVLA